MSSRPQFNPYTVIPNPGASPASTGSMATSITSAPTIIQKLSMVSYGVAWSAGSTPVGTISVQVSNDYSLNADGTVKNAGTWNTLTFSSGGSTTTTFAVSGNSGNGFIDIDQTGAYAIRLIYTRTSGSGTLAVVINGKVA